MSRSPTSSSTESSGSRDESFESELNEKIVDFSEKPLDWETAESLLKEFNASTTPHVTTRITDPRGGEIYIYNNDDKAKVDDWRADPYQWFQNGANKKIPTQEPALNKNYWTVKDQNKKQSE